MGRLIPLSVALLTALAPPAFARYTQPRSNQVIQTPTAFAIDKGSYKISTLVYDRGGIELKGFVAVNDSIFLGFSWEVRDALGTGTPKPSIPGLTAKCKLFNGWEYFPAVAIGYDGWYHGTSGVYDRPLRKSHRTVHGPLMLAVSPLWYLYDIRRYDRAGDLYGRMQYGPYAAFTSPVYLFDAEQFISFGIRVPLQPVLAPGNSSFFFALDIPIGQYFRIKAELDRVPWDFRGPREWIVGAGLRFTYFEQLAVEFDLMYEPGERLNRIIKIEYHGEF